MLNFKRWQATTALIMTLGMNATAIAPIFVAPMIASSAAPALAQASRFSDVPSSHWAKDYINALVAQNVLAGFPDGTFRPDAPVTRAQFSSMVQAVYSKTKIRTAINFVDVPSGHWAARSIRTSYEMGFLSGYPGNIFRPEQNIPREQVLVSLANGLNYSPNAPADQVLNYYLDGGSVSNFARSAVAAATEEQMVVNYPSINRLNPTRNATRAEVAAFLYQAMVSEGRVAAINSPYLANATPIATEYRIPEGTMIPVSYLKDKILMMPDETLPVTFTVRTNITTQDGKVLIPAGSQVKGELRPAGDDATQFVAQELIYPNGSKRPFSATSSPITETETVRRGTNTGDLLKNAALGTAAAAAIAAVTGDRAIATEELLIGAGAGAVLTLIQNFLGRNNVDLLVVEPETNLNLTLDEDFVAPVQ